jgi:methanogenic corrinoid protein MtbC1
VLKFDSGDHLRTAANFIADATLARDYANRPALLDRYGEAGKNYYREDVLHHVAALAASVDAVEPAMFLRYVEWLKILLVSRGIEVDDIAENLRCMAAALTDDTAHDHSAAQSHLKLALERLDSMPVAVDSFFDESNNDDAIAHQCLDDLLRLDVVAARATLAEAIESGTPLTHIYSSILPPLMREVGRLWQADEITGAHEHYCSAAIQSVLCSFYGFTFGASGASGRSLIVACVEGEQHELGARTVADVFELSGWRTRFLGANLPSRELVAMLKRDQRPPDLIALSVTRPERLARMASTIAAIRDSSTIPIIVGGYLFHENPRLAEALGADGCAHDAEAAVAVADALVPRPS